MALDQDVPIGLNGHYLRINMEMELPGRLAPRRDHIAAQHQKTREE